MLFFLLLTFWNYATFLSVLFMYFEIGVFKWRGRVGVGGDISLFTFPHFHTMIVYFSGSGHTKRYTQTVTRRRTDHLVLSFFLQQYDGTKSATVRVVSALLVVWRGTTPVWKSVVEKTRTETSPTPRIMSYQSSLQGSNG